MYAILHNKPARVVTQV